MYPRCVGFSFGVDWDCKLVGKIEGSVCRMGSFNGEEVGVCFGMVERLQISFLAMEQGGITSWLLVSLSVEEGFRGGSLASFRMGKGF